MAYTTYLSDSLSCRVTQAQGGGHRGQDIQFNPIYWSNICFPKSGTVVRSQNGGSGGLWTYGEWYEVDCGDGTSYRLAHLRAGSRTVGVGASVTAGQLAGVQGNTGQTFGDTGIHVHVEYFINGALSNPSPITGLPNSVGNYDTTFGGPDPPGPPPKPGAGWYWDELPERDTVPRHFQFMATQLTADETINTVHGSVGAKTGDWVIQVTEGLCDWEGLWMPRKSVYIEIPDVIVEESEVEEIE